MEIVETSISGVLVINTVRYEDKRGIFMESYNSKQYKDEAGIDFEFVQDSYSKSKKGVLRGLHYQIKRPQGKLILVTMGEIFDVVVDIRQSSQTFGQHIAIMLSQENNKQIWVPPGCAHGFYVISEWAEVFYKATDFYYPEGEQTLLWNDPKLKINWPISRDVEIQLSEKDKQGKLLIDAELFD